MGAIYKCQSNFMCFENFINLSVSCGILYYFVQRAKIIYYGNKGVLVPIDIILCCLGILQMIIQVIYYLCADTNIMLITIKCFGITIEILICVILISTVIDREKHNQLFWIGRLGLGAVVLLWIYEINIHYQRVYDCSEISNVYSSLFGLILSIVAFSVGFECVHDLHRYREYLLENKNDTYAAQLLKIEIRITQIKILKISGLIQFSVQFIWDVLVYFLSQTILECSFFSEPKALGSVIIYAVLNIVSLNTLPIAIFLVFYECNKEYFNMEHHIWNHERSHMHLQISTEQLINETEMQEVK